MRNRNYFLVCIFFIFYNCEKDFLNVVPDNIATIDLAFNNRATAERFLSTCYTYIPEHAHAEQNFSLVAGDEIWYYAENDFYMNNETSFRLAKGLQNSSSPYLNYWDGGRGAPHSLFDGLRDCNIFLENLVAVPGLTEEERQRWLAEVKVLKAFYHFWLLRMYGPIPIIRDNLYVGASLRRVSSSRNSVDEVVEYIVELIDEVIESDALPGIISYIYTEQGQDNFAHCKSNKSKSISLGRQPYI